MPVYEYECDKCKQILEFIQKFSDQPKTVHDSCGGNLTKKISKTSFQLKGQGWYKTDYPKSGQ